MIADRLKMRRRAEEPADVVRDLPNGIRIQIHQVNSFFWSVSAVSAETRKPLECYHAITSFEEAEILSSILADKYKKPIPV